MAQTGFTPISLFYSTTAATAPVAGNLVSGELAINITDGKLYYEDNAGVVQIIASKAGALGDVAGPASATDNAVVRFDLTTGKLIQNSVVTIADTTGDMAGVGSLNFSGPLLPNNLAGSAGQVLTSAGAGGVPTWATPAASNAISNGTSNVTIASSGGSVTTSVGGVSNVVTVSPSGAQNLSIGVGTAPSGTTGEIRATNNVTAYYSSDRRLKENIQTIPDALDKVDAIGGKTFDWNDEYIAEHGGVDGYFVQKSDFGVIAQDVQGVFPQAVRTRDDGTLAVDYEKLVAVAFAAIVELRAEVKLLKGE